MDHFRFELLQRLESTDTAEQIDAAIEDADHWLYDHAEDWDVREAREKAAAKREWLWHPIPHQQRKRVRREVERFFNAYYKKLRAEVARREDPSNPLPHYLKGYRKIRAYFCTDGVLISHKKADEGTDKETYTFTLSDRKVKELANYLYNPPLMGGKKLKPVIEDYADGAEFSFSLSDPRIVGTDLDETTTVYHEDEWTRLDFASLSRLDTWRRENKAREDAKGRVEHNLEKLRKRKNDM